MKKIFACIALFLASTLVYSADIEGFKDIKFGMTAPQLQDLGFACDPVKNSCVSYDFGSGNSYVKNGVTIFDKKVKSIHVALNAKGEASTITVAVNVNDAIAIQESMNATFGNPKKAGGSDADKNKGLNNSVSTTYWTVGNVELSTMTIFGGTLRTSAVIFRNTALAGVKDPVKPSKDF